MLTCYVGGVGKVLGEKWKALDAEDREPYEARAKADKERYETEKANYAVSLVLSTLRPHYFDSVSIGRRRGRRRRVGTPLDPSPFYLSACPSLIHDQRRF